MKLKKTLLAIGVVFLLSSFLITWSIIRSYRNFKNEIVNQIFSEQSLAGDIGLSRSLPQSVTSIATNSGNPPQERKEKKTFLNLRLLGTVLGNPAIVYIEDLASGRKGAYKIGDIISGAKIIDIQSGRVTLDRDGHRELLVFTGSREDAITEISPTEMIVSKNGVLREICNDADGTLTMAEVLPYFDLASRKFSGLKVDNIRKGSIVDSAGLQNGDIIKVINDQELSSPQKTIQVFRKVRNQPQIDVDILRKRQLITLKYEIKD